ncbi:MAG: efflux RND transporter periplasmic adaptor subunit, partial [Myxococcota bacterium]|nr:efflux RND transporter periplasmic adaptor subunit [Myxococcota bacterium]
MKTNDFKVLLLMSGALLCTQLGCSRKEEGAIELGAPAAPVQARAAAGEAEQAQASAANAEESRQAELAQRSFTGNLEAHRSVTVAAKMAGTIVQVHVEEGSLVQKGDPIVTVDAEDYRIIVEQAQSGLAMAEKQKKTLEREWKRLKALVEAKAAPSSQFDQLDGQLDLANEGIRTARLGLKRAQNALRDTVTTAPFTGMVSMRLVDEGALAMHMPPTMVT